MMAHHILRCMNERKVQNLWFITAGKVPVYISCFFSLFQGFEWNKYNQTHYDMDNPPPKIVQGYKFNVSFCFLLFYIIMGDEICSFLPLPPPLCHTFKFQVVKPRGWDMVMDGTHMVLIVYITATKLFDFTFSTFSFQSSIHKLTSVP